MVNDSSDYPPFDRAQDAVEDVLLDVLALFRTDERFANTKVVSVSNREIHIEHRGHRLHLMFRVPRA